MSAKKKTPPKAKPDKGKTGRQEEDGGSIKVKIIDESDEKTEDQRPEGGDLETVGPDTLESEEAIELSPEEAAKLVRELVREKEEQHERLLRIQADFDNYRKRTQKEQANLLRYGAENALREILPVIDNIELAVDSARTHDNSNSQLREGVEMILNQFFSALERLGVKPIETVDQPFDHNKHDALLRVHAPDAQEDTVVSEIRKGYYLHDKVLRPAQVTVGTRERVDASPADSGASEEAD